MILNTLARKIFGTQNERELKSIEPLVRKINSLEPSIHALSDDALRGKTDEFKARLKKGETLDDLLPEAFAVVREAALRVIGQRHYDVQLIGGITLHRGRIAEMRTGEGKTLVATLPCYLNALSGKGVHVVTVNDYLARRDSSWMGRIYGFLGMTTGIIVHGLTDAQRKQSYACDITYGTNNEFGFDYLRDNMKFRIEDYVQRELNFAIVDEVDSILIDEARTPLIISGPTEDSTDLYYKIDTHLRAESLKDGVHYKIEEKSKTATLLPDGISVVEKRLGVQNLYDPANIELLHHVNQALRAHVVYKRDVDYIVKDGQVVIIDEFTGRTMEGRRWSDGLHQAIEAKEGVQIENENQTLATITFQNFFRMYGKLGGMTGTADTEATEFKQIYKLDVTIIPTNRPILRQDAPDLIFKGVKGKYKAILEEIKELHQKGQPVLVGTVSVERSEFLSRMLKEAGVPHHVLNAKQHEREAEIVAQAGRKGSVTIATNMAGRGTDILLGGNPEALAKKEVGALSSEATPEEVADHQKRIEEAVSRWQESCARERDEVKALGGLFILGTERHESRRIDNQLRGRAGRQGDPGASRFYLSFEDDLLRIFGNNVLLQKTVEAMEDDVPIEHSWTTKSIENAQKKVEGHNYDIRKHLLQYDDVMNQQRKVVYAWRREVLSRDDLSEMIFSMNDEIAREIARDFFPNGKLKRSASGAAVFDQAALTEALASTFSMSSPVQEKEISPFSDVGLIKAITEKARAQFRAKEADLGPSMMRQLEKMVLLTTIDHLWKEHLLAMDHLRDGIGLRGYGQKDPLIAYKKEGFRYFEMMMGQITGDVIRKIYSVRLHLEEPEEVEGDDFLGWEGEAVPTPEISQTQQAPRMQYNIGPNGELIPVEAPASQTPPEQSQQPAAPSWSLEQRKATQRTQMGRGAMPEEAGGSPFRTPGAGGFGMGGAGMDLNALDRVGRNDPCPCGSGKKFKKCHGLA
jgi:preprotein translocase subunit SecA